MATARHQMHFLAFCEYGVINHAIGTWRHPLDKVGHHFSEAAFWQGLSRTLERGLFDAIFLADQLAPYNVYRGSVDDTIRYAAQCPVHDPAALVPVIALATTSLGIGITQSTTFEHPYPLCRRLSTLDHLSNGRIGWNIVTSYSSGEFQAMGLSDVLPRQERYARLEEFMEVCYALWNSWGEHAVIADRETGIYADPAQVGSVSHAGKYFRCHGPAFVSRSPQGQPVLWQAGSSEQGRSFAARHAEAVFSIQPNAAAMRRYVDDIRKRAAEHSISRTVPRIYMGIQVVLGKTRSAAQESLRILRENVHIDGALAKLSGDIGYDFSQMGLDEPLHEIDVPGIKGQFDALLGINGGQPVTLRQAAQAYSLSLAAPLLVGTAEDIADELAAMMMTAQNDGFMLLGTYVPGCFEAFVDNVVPLLQARGQYRRHYPGNTLRENMLND